MFTFLKCHAWISAGDSLLCFILGEEYRNQTSTVNNILLLRDGEESEKLAVARNQTQRSLTWAASALTPELQPTDNHQQSFQGTMTAMSEMIGIHS